MEIDRGGTSAKPGVVQSDPGTYHSNSGTAEGTLAEAMQIEPREQEALPMEIDPGLAEAEVPTTNIKTSPMSSRTK